MGFLLPLLKLFGKNIYYFFVLVIPAELANRMRHDFAAAVRALD